MTGPRGAPTGRAGRTWLRERLATAERGVELLQAKLQVLQRKQQRYHAQAERAAGEWEARCREAETWFVRAALLAGRRAFAEAVPPGPAVAAVTWTVSMGVSHPREAVVSGGEPSPSAALAGSAALPRAVEGYRAALQAGARHAVAAEAVRRIDAEVTATRRRLRAVQDRLVPRLSGALREVEVGLEETELAEGGRLRWAAAHPRRPGEERP